ncbi:hypothetical protein GIB67_014227 [Kingdonia uniflora]|uniref:Uncharacterized protein n=1 Tax=Kingdonia uniflora TaxID=39325 RepID=A0A7J7M1V5_9MAGN|nr:hypothetical protein GIB67_014227 [Kingdonia uniflora]
MLDLIFSNNIKPHYQGARGRGTRGDYNLFKLILEASPIFRTTLSRHSRSRYSRRLQLIQAYTRGEPDVIFRHNVQTQLQDSRSNNLTHTRGELDQHLAGRLLVRPIRSNRIHSTIAY